MARPGPGGPEPLDVAIVGGGLVGASLAVTGGSIYKMVLFFTTHVTEIETFLKKNEKTSQAVDFLIAIYRWILLNFAWLYSWGSWFCVKAFQEWDSLLLMLLCLYII